MATRRKKDVTGAADTATGNVAADIVEKVRNEPNVMAILPQASAQARQIEQYAELLPLVTQQDYEVMSDFLRQVKTLQKVWVEKFETITKPAYATWLAACKLRREITDPADKAEEILKRRIGEWVTARAREAEDRERQAREAQLAAQLAAQAQAQAQVQSPVQAQALAFAAPWAPVMPMPGPATAPTPAAVYMNPNAEIAAPRQAEGITTKPYTTVDVKDHDAAVQWLLQTGLAQGLIMVDTARLLWLLSESPDKEMWKVMLEGCPFIQVETHTRVTARSY